MTLELLLRLAEEPRGTVALALREGSPTSRQIKVVVN